MIWREGAVGVVWVDGRHIGLRDTTLQFVEYTAYFFVNSLQALALLFLQDSS